MWNALTLFFLFLFPNVHISSFFLCVCVWMWNKKMKKKNIQWKKKEFIPFNSMSCNICFPSHAPISCFLWFFLLNLFFKKKYSEMSNLAFFPPLYYFFFLVSLELNEWCATLNTIQTIYQYYFIVLFYVRFSDSNCRNTYIQHIYIIFFWMDTETKIYLLF